MNKAYDRKMNKLRSVAERMRDIDLDPSLQTDTWVDHVEPLAYLGGMAHGMGLTFQHAICAAEAVGLKLRGWTIDYENREARDLLRPATWVAEREALIARDDARRAAMLERSEPF